MAKMAKFGDHRERKTFSRVKNTLELTDLLEIQKKSYQRFLEEGIKEVFEDLFPVESFTGNISLELGEYYFETPRYTVKEAKERMVNYAAPLKVQARVFIHETGEVKEQEIFLGDLPLMTDAGTFIINGAERVIVSQLVRSPSVYYKKEIDKNGRKIISGEIIPNKGTWLEYELDARDIFYVRIDRTRKVVITAFLRALGLSSDEDIYEVIEADAFNQTDISDVVFNVNHGDGNHAVARTRNNTLKLDKQDDGIHCTVYLDKSNPRCVQVYKDVSSGLLDRMSFAFTIKDEEFDKNENCYHIKSIDKVFDVSAVEFPAYESTSISARRISSAVAERELAVAKNLETKRELLLKRIERNLERKN